jgi:hypothetical protein
LKHGCAVSEKIGQRIETKTTLPFSRFASQRFFGISIRLEGIAYTIVLVPRTVHAIAHFASTPQMKYCHYSVNDANHSRRISNFPRGACFQLLLLRPTLPEKMRRLDGASGAQPKP